MNHASNLDMDGFLEIPIEIITFITSISWKFGTILTDRRTVLESKRNRCFDFGFNLTKLWLSQKVVESFPDVGEFKVEEW